MSTKLKTITSSRTNRQAQKSIYVPQIDLIAFDGGTVDGPCLQLEVWNDQIERIQLTKENATELRDEIDNWLRTRF